jgi:hypothetical protein
VHTPPVRAFFLASIAAGAGVAVFLAGCSRGDHRSADELAVSYAPREPGSGVTPTHEISFALIAADGPTRHANFQRLITDSSKPCKFVTSAVLKGGLDGTDEWRVTCADAGRWAVWFRPDGASDLIQCTSRACT